MPHQGELLVLAAFLGSKVFPSLHSASEGGGIILTLHMLRSGLRAELKRSQCNLFWNISRKMALSTALLLIRLRP